MALSITLVYLASWVVLQARVIDSETEAIEHVRDGHRGRLLTVHTDSEGLDAAEK